MNVHVLVCKNGKILVCLDAETAIVRQSEFGGEIREVTLEEHKCLPTRLREFGPSGVNLFGGQARRRSCDA